MAHEPQASSAGKLRPWPGPGALGGGIVWTVAQAKARLSEVLRMAEAEGPQTIGKRKSFVVVSADTWNALTSNQEPLGHWLIENTPRGQEPLVTPPRSSERSTPFIDEDGR